MKPQIRQNFFAFITITLFSLSATNAQIIYTNVNPDAKFSCSKAGCSQQFNLDLNNDGINDFAISTNKFLSFCGSNNYNLSVYVTILDSNGMVASNPLPLNAVINDQSIYSTGSITLESYYWYVNPRGGGCIAARTGAWSSSADGYLGLKLKKGGNTYYGWAHLLVSVSSKSASFTIKDYAYNRIPSQLIVAGQSTNLNVVATSAITGSPFCAGSKVGVPYQVEGTFNASNIFTAQLSDSTGSFSSPVTIGSKQSAVAGTINAKIPFSTLTGSQYRIRVISSSPASPSYDNGTDLIISTGANAVISASGPTEFCSGSGVVMLSTSSMYGYTFQWLNNGTPIPDEAGNQIYASSTGNYQCVVTNGCGSDTSNTIVVIAYPLPNAIITPSGPTVFCKGGSVTLYANADAGLTYKWIVYPSGDTVSTNSFYVAADTINHYYQVMERSAKGCVNYSDLVFVEIITKEPAPTIYARSETNFCSGDSVSLFAVIKYFIDQFQWKKDGTNIPGATSQDYTAKTAGVYKCTVTNMCGSAATPGITITVNACFTATEQKSSNTISANRQGNLDPTVIYPSAIIQIKNTDPNLMKNSLRLSGKDENELSEESRNTTGKTESNFLQAQNNFLDNKISSEQKKSKVCPPLVQTNFEGNPLTPFYLPPVGYYASESSIAVSNAGKIVSISNGWMRYYNEDGSLVFSDSLYHFGNSLIDVHVMYDPKKDRFVFIAAYGITDFISIFQGLGTVIAFSKTNDPVDGWNFYFLPDSLFKDNCSGDYPQLGMSDGEVFITELRLNKGGNINQSLIVQMDKNAGYAGKASINLQVYNVQLSSSTKGPIEPASGGATTYGPNMYFLMAYESGKKSDKYYVFEITNTITSGNSVLKTYGPVHSDISYSGSGVSYQPGGIALVDALNPNDVSVNGAFYENGLIQFCQITNTNGKAAINLGRISGMPNNLSCTAKTISDPNLYLSFPSIAYAGNSSSDNSAIIGIEHTGATAYPGLSAVYVNSNFEISPITTVKSGSDTINGLWGDYSGICRRYNHPGECWYEGQYGSTTFPNINWIAKITAPVCHDNNTLSASNSHDLTSDSVNMKYSLSSYPNPFSNSTAISFSIPQSQTVSISIYDMNGRLIKTLVNAKMQAGTHQLAWNAKDEQGNTVGAGVYFLRIQTKNYTESKKLSLVK